MKPNSDFFLLLREFLTVHLPMRKCCSEQTIKAYRETLNMLVEYMLKEKNVGLMKISFSVFDTKFINEFLDWLQATRHISANTRNHRLSVLRSFFKYAGRTESVHMQAYLESQSVVMQNAPKKIVEYLSENALKALLGQPDISDPTGYRNMVFMTLMYDSAGRCSEILDLRIRDLRINSNAPTVFLTGKGSKARQVPIMTLTAKQCQNYIDRFHPANTRKEDDYLFYTVIYGKRHRMSADNVAYFMKKYGEQAGKLCLGFPDRVTPHQLRHTRAIHLYRGGMPLSLLSEYLGHANIETTKIYAYADSEMKREAIQKADNIRGVVSSEIPVWENNEEVLRTLAGLITKK